MRIKTVFFDLDGTLWSTAEVALLAYRQTFAALGRPLPEPAVLLDTLGYPTAEIWQKLLPNASRAERELAQSHMERAELAALQQGLARPFPGVPETLQHLQSAGLVLCILSNCDAAYLQAVPDALGIGDCFQKRFCAADFPDLSKTAILKQVLPQFSLPAAMVGDRWHDIAAGRANGMLTIGCDYGLGQPAELAAADRRIAIFSELKAILAGEE